RRQEARGQGHLHRGISHRSPEDGGGQARDQCLRAAEVTAMQKQALIAALFAVLVAAPARADDAFPSAISVSGEATISVVPDLAHIDAGVASDAKTAKEAADINNAAMGKVLLALKGAGIDEKDYQTSRLSLQPQYAPNRTGTTSSVTGFHA